VHLPLQAWLNGSKFGEPECAVDMTFDFAQLVAHAAKTRPLSAGSIIGSGTISNKLDDGPASRSLKAARAIPASPKSA
jgi:fumarylacetoacetate (FAA) hydrolase